MMNVILLLQGGGSIQDTGCFKGLSSTIPIIIPSEGKAFFKQKITELH